MDSTFDTGRTSTLQVFTGGSGRSGTTVLGHLLDHHPLLGRTMPREVRFITERGGLLDLLTSHSRSFSEATGLPDPNALAARIRYQMTEPLPRRARLRLGGRLSLEEFIERMSGYWFYRKGQDGKERGLHRGIDRSQLTQFLNQFKGEFDSDPVAASSSLVMNILASICDLKSGWVETTPDNVICSPSLIALLPQAKVLHVVRDGRDVASSVVKRSWGPTNHVQALRWWGRRMYRAYESLSSLPLGSVLTLRIEDLVVNHRDDTYRSLLSYLNVADDTSMRAFFDEFLIPRRLHQSRWRDELRDVSAGHFDDLYFRILYTLRSRFGNVPPTEDLPANTL